MYVVPDSTIILLKGCPLNKNYEHTIYFDSVAAQTNYFMSLAKRTFNKCTYQRELRGRCSLQVNTADIYDCNYMMYRNTAYNDKWFYAFIDRVEWVNNANTNVYFTIDVMQTWFFDYELQLSFVEREHTVSDEYFEHTIPENLGYGENIVLSRDWLQHDGFIPDAGIFITSEPIPNSPQWTPSTYYGQYFPVYAYTTIIPAEGEAPRRDDWMERLNAYIAQGRQDGVISVYSIPRFMCRIQETEQAVEYPPEEIATYDFDIAKNLTLIGDYKPKNKKLFCYPYNFLRVSNNTGSAIDYRYEDFSTDVCQFRAYGTAVPTPTVTVVPRYYLGAEEMLDCSLNINAYPPIPYTGDVYAAYMAMNRNTLELAKITPSLQAGLQYSTWLMDSFAGFGKWMINTAGNLAGAGGKESNLYGAAIGGVTSAGAGLLDFANRGLQIWANEDFQTAMVERQQLAKQSDIQMIPETVGGMTQASSVMIGTDMLRPIAYRMGIKPEYAATIDSYFDRYGYQCNETKIPNRNVRPHWTYTKTVGCTINARCPSDDEETICQIYNKGVTFWRVGSEVGDYSLDNSV